MPTVFIFLNALLYGVLIITGEIKMSLDKFIGKTLNTTDGKLKIESAKFSGVGCGDNMEVIKYVSVEAGGLKIDLTLSDLEKLAI